MEDINKAYKRFTLAHFDSVKRQRIAAERRFAKVFALSVLAISTVSLVAILLLENI